MIKREKENSKIIYKNNIVVIFYILSFLLPLLMHLFIFKSMGIGYFENNLVITSDMQGQFMPFIASLRYLLENPANILFNWNYSLGGNFLGVFAYYMASPLNIITLFFDIKHMPDAMQTLQLVKIGLCGLSFFVFLQGKYKKEKPHALDLLFSTCYALMSYNMIYSICIIWIDAVILLPMIILGVEQILEGKKGALYFVSITFAFISNYYMSYMVGIFAAGYFVLGSLLQLKKESKKLSITKYLRFGLLTLFGMGIAMPLILPAVLNVSNRYGRETIPTAEHEAFYSITALLQKLLPSQYDSVIQEGGAPYVFCGSVMLVLAIVYFVQKRNVKEKIVNLALICMVFAGFVSTKADYVWHGLRYPNSFPFRYAFIFSFLVILLAYEALLRFEIKKSTMKLIVGCLAFYTVMELFMNGTAIVGGIVKEIHYDNREAYYLENRMFEPLADEIRKDTGFYRMGNNMSESEININAATMYGLHGTDFFSSSAHQCVADFTEKMGGMTADAYQSSRGLTPLMDSLLGIKYRVGKKDPYGLYDEKMKSKTMKLYENHDALGLGYLKQGQGLSPSMGKNPFENQELLLSYLGVEGGSVYSELTQEVEKGFLDDLSHYRAYVKVLTEAPVCYYINCDLPNDGWIQLYLDGELHSTTYARDSGQIFVMQGLHAGEEHEFFIVSNAKEIKDLYLYQFNTEAYRTAIQSLAAHQLENVICDGNVITGTISAPADGTLFVTLPYDEGYTVYVDGKKTPYHMELDTFMGIDVPAGEHKVKLVYMPPGLIPGGIVSVIMIVCGLGYFVVFPMYGRAKVKKHGVGTSE